MKENNLISREELINFFHHHNYHVQNKEKVAFDLRLPGRIIVSWQLDVIEKEKYTIRLQTEYKLLKNFIRDNRIQSIQDLQKISQAELWIRYLRNKGQVSAHIHQYNTGVIFTVTNKGRTVVEGDGCGFVGMADKTLSLPEQFEKYISDNMEDFKAMRRVRFELLKAF